MGSSSSAEANTVGRLREDEEAEGAGFELEGRAKENIDKRSSFSNYRFDPHQKWPTADEMWDLNRHFLQYMIL